jgi:hypothetical protein
MPNAECRMTKAEWARTPASSPSPLNGERAGVRGENVPAAPESPSPSIHLHIKRLVVDAPVVGSARREILQAHVEAELLRLLTEAGLCAVDDAAAAQQSGGSIRVAAGSTPAQLGRQIAQATYAALNMAEPSGPAPEPTLGTR